MRDIYNHLKITQVANEAAADDTIESAIIDTQGYGSNMVVFDVGESGDTLSGSIYWTLTVEEGDDTVSFTAVDDADLHNGVDSVVIDAPAEDGVAVKFGYKGNKRYLKGVATPTGSHSNGTPIGILAVQGHAANEPVS